jgi:hypothetical protein
MRGEEMSYTKGPWKIKAENHCYYERIESDQGLVVVFKGGARVYNREDLLLILAAPDLLETLEELLNTPTFDGSQKTSAIRRKIKNKAKAAIAKARGR